MLEDFERKPRLNLPSATDRRWAQLDRDLDITLDNTLKGDVTKKIKTMVKTVFQACLDTFGVKECNVIRPPAGPSRRQRHIKELREQLRTLRKRWQKANDEEKPALNQIWVEVRKNLILLCKAESLRKKQRKAL